MILVIKRVLVAFFIAFASYSTIKTLGPIIGSYTLPSLHGLNNSMSKEAGELVVLIGILQGTLLIIVLARGWQGAKPVAAGILAGLLLGPIVVLRQIDEGIGSVSKTNPYTIVEDAANPEISELHVNGKIIIIPKKLSEEIKSQYPQQERKNAQTSTQGQTGQNDQNYQNDQTGQGLITPTNIENEE